MAKRLLLTVGLNDYPGSGADLRGCVNDSNDVVAALAPYGYAATQLLDGRATRPAFTGVLEGMVRSLRRGDRLVVHYSGHGTNIADRDGDEADGRDEALVMHDYASGGLITDDELHEIFAAKAAGSRILFLPDSCHSGTNLRLVGPEVPAPGRTAAEHARPRFLDVDLLTGRAHEPAPVVPHQRSRTVAGLSMMSGCDDPEYSYDASFGGRPNGAFTYWALRTLAEQRPRSLGAWHKAVRQALPSESFPQSPQLATSSRWYRYAPAL